MTAPAALAPDAPAADPERLRWLTAMIFMHRPGPITPGAYDRAAGDAAAIIASGTCPDPSNHRLHVIYLAERCLACGGHEGPQWAGSAVPA
jgi:hypothetical protein